MDGLDAGAFLSALTERDQQVSGTTALSGLLRGQIGEALATSILREYILSGAQHPHFLKVLCELTTEPQQTRILSALAPLS